MARTALHCHVDHLGVRPELEAADHDDEPDAEGDGEDRQYGATLVPPDVARRKLPQSLHRVRSRFARVKIDSLMFTLNAAEWIVSVVWCPVVSSVRGTRV